MQLKYGKKCINEKKEGMNSVFFVSIDEPRIIRCTLTDFSFAADNKCYIEFVYSCNYTVHTHIQMNIKCQYPLVEHPTG